MNLATVDAPARTWRSLTDALTARAAEQAGTAAYIYAPPRERDRITLTYGELERRSKSIAQDLIGRGLTGRSVLLLYPPGLEFIEAFYGCMYANVSAVPMYIPPQSRPDARLTAIVQRANISAVLTCGSRLQAIDALACELFPSERRPIIATDLIASTDSIEWSVRIDEDVFPLIQFTSGSTSRPKGVRVSHQNILVNQHMIQRGFGHQGGETVVSWLPFFHDMGLIGAIMQPVYIGGTSVLMSSADFLQNPDKWLHLISEYEAHTSGAPNFAYDYCISKVSDEQIDGLDLSRWKVAYNGAEMIRPETMVRFTDRFSPAGFDPRSILNCYGMAETTLYLAAGRCFPDGIDDGSRSDPESIACVGHPAAESTVRIVDEQRRVLGQLEIGEIWTRGPQIACGYLDDTPTTAEIFEAELPEEPGVHYLRTGDLGFLDEGGLHIVGRLKNMIILNGKNYYGEEVEHFAGGSDTRFYPSGVCVMQLNEGKARSDVVLAIEIRKDRLAEVSDEPVQLDSIGRLLAASILKRFGLPVRRVCFLRENRLPRTSSGKIDRGNSPKFVTLERDKLLYEVLL